MARRICKLCNKPHWSLQCTPKRHRGVDWDAIMAYQVKSGEEMTLEQIAEVGGVTRERIRQIDFEAMRKLAKKPSVRLAVSRALGE